jgi:predicted dinucleotide-binding enzyme
VVAGGHDVVICFSRHPAELAARAAELGGDVRAAAPADAVLDADVVMLAMPWGAIDQALGEVGPLAGKVVLDATNQFGAGPKPAEGQTVARFNSARMPGARYVRGFNTLTSGFCSDLFGWELDASNPSGYGIVPREEM